jgi:hypothetical protein
MPNTITYAIYPAIGIARLGASKEFFIGPEPDMDEAAYDDIALVRVRRKPLEPSLRDAGGALKRQAVRFRILKLEFNDTGQPVSCRQIDANTAGVASIAWTVRLANRKAYGRNFLSPGTRNSAVTNDRAKRLILDSGKQTISGPGQSMELSGFFFEEVEVVLGEIATDDRGRLSVVGPEADTGYVLATGERRPLSDLTPDDVRNEIDNDHWFDNTGDGPVTARITFSDGSAPVDLGGATGAWAIVAPFDFAPEIESFVTLYDIAYQAAVELGKRPDPTNEATEFWTHVFPVLRRSRDYRWVNSAAMRGEMKNRHTTWREGSGHTDPALLKELADPAHTDPQPGKSGMSWRGMLMSRLRDPLKRTLPVEPAMPRLHSDDRPDSLNGAVLPLTAYQYDHLLKWSKNSFTAGDAPAAGEEMTYAPRMHAWEALTRVALDAGSGGPFYPGIEAAAAIAERESYLDAFRIDAATVRAGGLTERLAVPWQADFLACEWDGDSAWWPATRPDMAFTDPDNGGDEWQKVSLGWIAEEMRRWDRGVNNALKLVRVWHKLGIVRRRVLDPGQVVIAKDMLEQGPGGTRAAFVETQRTLP